ncbi:hypothetical protein DFH11DRAFT_1732016 [Phellopilus nigrolimitatus]|nr:hypothetical protein DFH11DRAFT_1732016 [Phellopilus nigrolimitatus]
MSNPKPSNLFHRLSFDAKDGFIVDRAGNNDTFPQFNFHYDPNPAFDTSNPFAGLSAPKLATPALPGPNMKSRPTVTEKLANTLMPSSPDNTPAVLSDDSDSTADAPETPKAPKKRRQVAKTEMDLDQTPGKAKPTSFHSYIYVQLPDVVVGVGKRAKLKAQRAVKRGPLTHGLAVTYDEYLFDLAREIHTHVDLIDLSRLEWNFITPAKAEPNPLGTQNGFSVMLAQVCERARKAIPVINILLPAPRTDSSLMPWEASGPTSGTSATDSAALLNAVQHADGKDQPMLNKGRLTSAQESSVERLKKQYPDEDPDHCDIYTIPIGTAFFKPKNRMKKASPVTNIPPLIMPVTAGPSQGEMPKRGRSPETPLMGRKSRKCSSPSSLDCFSDIHSSLPLLDGTISIEEFVREYKLNANLILKLEALGFTPGVNVNHVQKEELKEAGFMSLSWSVVVKANKHYRCSMLPHT